MILWNSGSWIGIAKKTIKILDNFFHFFCQVVFRVSIACPKPCYYTQTGACKFKFLILQNKLYLSHHLANLPVGTLGRDFWEVEVSKKTLPGLFKEVEPHMENLKVQDFKEIPKWSFKKR